MDHRKSTNLIKIEEIFNILKGEIHLNSGPQPVPHNFYQNIANLISLLKEQNEKEYPELQKENEGTEKISQQINSNLVNLVAKLTTLIFILRCKKIFNNSKSQSIFEYSNLTNEEKYVFFGNREREQRINIILNMLLEGKSKTLEKIVSSINQNFVILRFFDSMEQFVGVNMNKYGPYRKDDVAIIPFENARSIIENNRAVEIRKID
ncbi:DNA replication complex subunit Gins51 [Candidatus Nitrosocosmicus sp. T]